MASLRQPFGLGIERDILFERPFPLSVYTAAAIETGSVAAPERILYRAANAPREGL